MNNNRSSHNISTRRGHIRGFLLHIMTLFINVFIYNVFKFLELTYHVNLDDSGRFLDVINLRIIDILSKESSTTFVERAKQIGISDATVHLRVRRLVAAGIITKFTISVDNNLLGYDHLAFMGINVEPGFADEATLELANLDEVLEIHEMHGTFDLLLKIRARDLNQMRDVVENKIRKLPHILETELMTVLKTKKEEQIVSLKKDILYKTDGVIA